jgi:hypothetical protein
MSFLIYNYTKWQIVDNIIYKIFSDVNVVKNGNDLDSIDIDILKITDNNLVIDCFSKLEPQHLWGYLKETLNNLLITPYAKYLIKNNTINMDFFNIENTINLKNVYNIAKTLSHDNIDDDKFTFIGGNFKAINEYNGLRFLKMFFNEDIKWLRISENIKLQEGDNDFNLINILKNIEMGWNKIKYSLVWDYLNDNGLLSEFNINLDLTDDKSLLTLDENTKIKIIQNRLKRYLLANPKLFDCNYFLTNEPYNKLRTFNKKTYLESLTEKITS